MKNCAHSFPLPNVLNKSRNPRVLVETVSGQSWTEEQLTGFMHVVDTDGTDD